MIVLCRAFLDILGADPNLSVLCLLAKQHNMGKVYSGLYECATHVVRTYLVLVKIGKPTELTRPGNRGKRDSQMLSMHFLNMVRFSHPQVFFFHLQMNITGSLQFANH
jgi:chitin synthase